MLPIAHRSALCVLVALLAGCGGSGGGSGSAPLATGTLLVPASVDDTTELALARRLLPGLARMSQRCPAVPAGYSPLSGADVVFLGVDDVALSAGVTSDDCGAFEAAVPDGTVAVRAQRTGFRPLRSDIATFTATGDTNLASTIAVDASYRIDALQVLDDSLGFAVTDSATRQAVLGLPVSAFSLSVDGANVPVRSVGLAASSDENASIALALDASGSMSATAFTDPATGERLSRNQLAALAAHTFLDQKAADDEVAVTVFSSGVYFMDQAAVDERLPSVDAQNRPVAYPFDEDGFVSDPAPLRFVVDGYDRDSDLYRSGTGPRHPDTPADLFLERYRFGGSTAFYDAIAESVDRLMQRGVARPVVVAMTDGRDNASSLSLEDVISVAQGGGVPVYNRRLRGPRGCRSAEPACHRDRRQLLPGRWRRHRRGVPEHPDRHRVPVRGERGRCRARRRLDAGADLRVRRRECAARTDASAIGAVHDLADPVVGQAERVLAGSATLGRTRSCGQPSGNDSLRPPLRHGLKRFGAVRGYPFFVGLGHNRQAMRSRARARRPTCRSSGMRTGRRWLDATHSKAPHACRGPVECLQEITSCTT